MEIEIAEFIIYMFMSFVLGAFFCVITITASIFLNDSEDRKKVKHE